VKTLIAALFLAFFTLSGDLRACPNCKEALSAQPEETVAMADGFNWSILFMLAVPATVFGSGAYAVRRAVKQGLMPEL
jgi:hypothetical protein